MRPLILASSLLLLVLQQISFANQISYNCIFDKGYETSFDGTPSGKTLRDKFNIVFDNIDYNQGIARMRGTGSGQVSVLQEYDLTFFERTAVGNFTITTIFRSQSKYNAVHSRHIGGLGGPYVAQFYGICK